MHKVKQLQEVPTGLAEFTESYPDERDWQVFKDYRTVERKNAYESLRDELLQVQNHLCAYCEIKVTREAPYPPRIEHFCPKSLDKDNASNYTFEISNLFAVCNGGTQRNSAQGYSGDVRKENYSCDASKGDKSPTSCKNIQHKSTIDILKPSEIPASPAIFTVALSEPDIGKLKVNDKLDQETRNKAEEMLKPSTLNLNCPRLVDLRKEIIEKLQNELDARYANPVTDDDMLLIPQQLAKEYLFDKDGQPGEFFTTLRTYFTDKAGDIVEELYADYLGKHLL